MAIFAPLLGRLRGSLGGCTATRCGSGDMITRRKQPTNPQSHLQSTARSIWARVLGDWGALDVDQRARWNAYAARTRSTNRFGNAAELSGQNWFVCLNSRQIHAGNSPRVDPPSGDTVPPGGIGRLINFQIVSPLTLWIFPAAAPPAGSRFIVWWSGEIGAAKNPGLTRARICGYSGVSPGGITAIDLPEPARSGGWYKFWLGVMDEYGRESELVIQRERFPTV